MGISLTKTISKYRILGNYYLKSNYCCLLEGIGELNMEIDLNYCITGSVFEI